MVVTSRWGAPCFPRGAPCFPHKVEDPSSHLDKELEEDVTEVTQAKSETLPEETMKRVAAKSKTNPRQMSCFRFRRSAGSCPWFPC